MIHRHTKLIALISTLICAAALGTLLVFWYVIETKRTALNDALTLTAEAHTKEQELHNLERTLEQTNTHRVHLEQLILTDEEVIDLLSLIETLGREQGTVLTTSALTVHEIDSIFEELSVTVSIEGSYVSVMRIMTLLEALPYQSSITRVSLERVTDEYGVWAGTVEIRVTKFAGI
jgi:Tfp pilus assembly protein PilO